LFKSYKFSESDKKWLNEQFDILLNVEADLEYKTCILNGQWPTCIKILERCLENAYLNKRQQELEREKKVSNA